MIVQSDQINEQASIETLSLFLRSSPITYIVRLSIQQIDLLLSILPSAYTAPVIGNERSRAVIEQCLNIRRRQLVERQLEGRQSFERQKANFLTLVAAYFVALVAISSCFKSTSLPITNDGKVETVGPQAWDLGFG